MKLRLKKAAALATAVIMRVFSLTGCKSDSGDSGETSAEATETTAAEIQSADVGYVNPDWTYGQVFMGGGGFVTGLIACPTEKNLFFARGDVGGAYRWNEE